MVPQDGDTALMNAAEKGHTEFGEMLVKAGADIEQLVCGASGCWETALMMAAQKGHTEFGEMLVKAGADMEQKNEVSPTDGGGVTVRGGVWTALIIAAMGYKQRGYTEFAEVLVKAGARVNREDEVSHTGCIDTVAGGINIPSHSH